MGGFRRVIVKSVISFGKALAAGALPAAATHLYFGERAVYAVRIILALPYVASDAAVNLFHIILLQPILRIFAPHYAAKY